MPFDAHVVDQVFLDDLEILQLLVEMTGEQQHGVFQLALGVVQRALAEIAGHDGGADRNRRDQQNCRPGSASGSGRREGRSWR